MVARSKPVLLVAAVLIITFGVHWTLSYQRWSTGLVPSWDLGIFSQLAKAYSLGQAPIVPIKGEGFNLLGDHFHPMLVLLGPLWALWPSPLALLMAQSVLFAVSGIPITRYAIKTFGAPFGVLTGLAYGLSWGLQSATNSQFHEIAFTVPLVSFGVVAFLEGRLVPASIWLCATVFTKEDMGLTVAAFGLVLWLVHRSRSRLAGMVAIWGLVWTIASMGFILPSLNPYHAYDYTGRLGGLGNSLLSLDTYTGLVMLIAAMGLIGIRSPLAIMVLPTLGWRLAGNVPTYWGWEWHYSASLMPIAFACLLDQVSALGLVREPQEKAANSSRPNLMGWWALALAIASSLALGPQQPIRQLGNPDYWNTWRVPGMTAAMERVPQSKTVLTDLALLAYLVPTNEVYWVGTPHPSPEVIVVDRSSPAWSTQTKADLAGWAEKEFGHAYQVTYNSHGFLIAERR